MRIVAVVVVLLLVAGTARAAAESPLDSKGIRNKIVGNTITIVTRDLRTATGFVEEDGGIRGHVGGDPFEGTWTIRDDRELCFDLPDRTFDICRVVVDDGKHVKFFTTTGEPAGRADVLTGNPYNL
jgi:hypothetical protein